MSESEENFEALRRLLALKRHEVPPPGYFDSFSRQVVARLRAGGASGETVPGEGLWQRVPWLLRILQMIEGKPVFVGSFATALCVLLLGGVVYSEFADAPMSGQPLTHMTPFVSVAEPISGVSLMLPPSPSTPSNVGLTADFNPDLQPVASLFGQQNALLQPVSFSIPGN